MYQVRCMRAAHHSHQHPSPIKRGHAWGNPPSHSGHRLGEVSRRKSYAKRAGGGPRKRPSPPTFTTRCMSGNSDQGKTAATHKANRVPETVIASGMIFSSTSIREPTSINEIRTRWQAYCASSTAGEGAGSPGSNRPSRPISHQ
ncbi:MAG: hypothetical protein A2V98_25010 [Planctomycetes bacterium RBG_16_64_12]|nr:MAG: hypothetical protein A2V98_25010 [Planctomycetes bacterium RBG_16_64_12]